MTIEKDFGIIDKIEFRLANIEDAQEILDIYAPYVVDTAITFEYDIPSIAEFTERVKNLSSEYPYIVCLYEGKIIGYAYAHRAMERAAYQWNAELSIYLHMEYRDLGIGKILYNKLIDILKLQNIQNVYGCITGDNEKSIKFHEKLGFSLIGMYHQNGYKFGKWYDVAWLEKSIANKEIEPRPLLTINDVDKKQLEDILKYI